MRGLAIAALALALTVGPYVQAQMDPWSATGSASFYWHNQYHGILAMSAYGNYTQTCPETFTTATLQRQYPGNTNKPFEVVGTWGPTPIYKSEGFMVRVPEMNKILMVFKGIYGWQNFNATLSPFLGIGCNSTCKAHTGALEAWAEVKAATNDMAAIQANQGDLVFSASGHGFGGMIAQVAALDLKHRGYVYSCQTFGSPPVFNNVTANVYNSLFEGDSIPSAIPIGNGSDYTFVLTGIHVFGTSSMYGQDYKVCEGWAEDPECAGGASEADHYFYFTDIGTCGAHWAASYDQSFDNKALASDQASQVYNVTATAPLLSSPVTTVAPPPATSTAPISTSSTSSPTPISTDTLNSTPISAAEQTTASGTAAGRTSSSATSFQARLAMGSQFLLSVALGCALFCV